MTRMESDVNRIVSSLKCYGFKKKSNNILLKPCNEHGLFLWAAYTLEDTSYYITFGAIFPQINIFALNLIEECSDGRIKPQFSPKLGPPIYIPVSNYIGVNETDAKIDDIIMDFLNIYAGNSLKDWFEGAIKLIPYGPSQTIIIPSYLLLNNEKKRLVTYIQTARKIYAIPDINLYYDKIERMSENRENVPAISVL